MKTLRTASLCLLLALLPAAATGELIIHKQRSLYQTLVVWEARGERCLTFSHRRLKRRQTCIDLQRPQRLVFPYYRMALAGLLLNPQPERLLMIGLGGGVLAGTLARLYPGQRQDLVEIDPAVAQVARDHFGFRPTAGAQVHTVDGRVFTRRARLAGKSYDFIILDAFNGDYIPEHLMTVEFLQEVKALLAPGGVLVANTFASSGLYAHESATYQAVFGDFFNFRMPGTGNRVILAGHAALPSREALAANAKRLAGALAPYGVRPGRFLRRLSRKRDWDQSARPLTDQYSPANLLQGQGE